VSTFWFFFKRMKWQPWILKYDAKTFEFKWNIIQRRSVTKRPDPVLRLVYGPQENVLPVMEATTSWCSLLSSWVTRPEPKEWINQCYGSGSARKPRIRNFCLTWIRIRNDLVVGSGSIMDWKVGSGSEINSFGSTTLVFSCLDFDLVNIVQWLYTQHFVI